MSAYEELCDIYLQSRDRLEVCREACAQQFVEVTQHLVKKLEIPEQSLRFINLNDHDSGTTYTIPGAITLGADGFWHLGLLVIFHKEGTAPAFQLLFDLHLKEYNAGFIIKISDEEPGLVLHPGDSKALDKLPEAFRSDVREWFDSYVERVLNPEENVYEGHGTYL